MTTRRVVKPEKPPRKRHGNRQPGDRKVAGTDRMTLIVEMIPRKVVLAAREKARARGQTLKSVVVDMLEAYSPMSQTKTLADFDDQLVDGVRMNLGLHPYNGPSNICWNDNYHWRDLIVRFGETKVSQVAAILRSQKP